jgi:adenine/guanine phosphoribosyltransferase-like PRPP-binding protein
VTQSASAETYAIEIGGVRRDLPIVEVASGVRIAVLNILGDMQLVRAAARELAAPLREQSPDVLVTAESKSIPLVQELADLLDLPNYVVLRKRYRTYMGDALEVETVSITTGAPQTLYLDHKDRDLVAGRRVVIVDDVVSTGSTLEGMRAMVDRAGGTIVAEAAIFTEGDPEQWRDIVALGHLPIFTE